MEIISLRRWYTDNSTISELSINPGFNHFCYVMEPTIRVGKDPRGIVAIPEGHYEIVLYDSPHFNMKVPLLTNVPGHDHIEIHPGNFEGSVNPETNKVQYDSKDCLIPGLDMGTDYVGRSRNAFNLLFHQVDMAINNLQRVFITVKNGGIHA